jgi:small subunit ribosomal protein S1
MKISICVGDIVTGKIARLVPDGAIVAVNDGGEGLVALSELSDRPVDLPEQVVAPGEVVRVSVIGVDPLTLSIKQAA